MKAKLKKNFIKFHAWLKSHLGQNFIETERNILENITIDLFYKEVLIIGQYEFIESFPAKENSNIILLNQDLENLNPETKVKQIHSKEYKLAIESESIDLLYLAHSLEFNDNAHEVLREAYRVLKPEGYLVITTFNAISFWGIIKIILRILNKAPWIGKFYSNIKLIDWLKLLGFDIFKSKSYFHNLPISNKKYLNTTGFINKIGIKLSFPFGAGLMLLACKRVLPLTPIIPKWKIKQSIFSDQKGLQPTPNSSQITTPK